MKQIFAIILFGLLACAPVVDARVSWLRPPEATQGEAEAGTETDLRSWSPSLVKAVASAADAGGITIISDADGISLTSDNWGQIILMTGAGEVALPDAGEADIGKYIMVLVRDASEQVEVVLADATEHIVLSDGTALDAGDEADMPTNAYAQATFLYLGSGVWLCRGEANGSVTDGGVAD